jgi:gliding motility-associated-like protein
MKKILTLVLLSIGLHSWSQSVVLTCFGSTAQVSGTNPQNLSGATYSIQPGGQSGGTNPNFTVTPGVTTNYTVYTTGTNTVPTVTTTSVVVTVSVLPQPYLTPTLYLPNCTSTVSGFNLGLTFSPTASNPGYTVSWQPIPNGITSAQQTSVASGVAAGPYTVLVVADGGCGYIMTFTMTPPPAPANYSFQPFGLTNFQITCNQPTITVSVSNPALSYTWSSPVQSQQTSTEVTLTSTSVATPTSITVYTVIGTNTISNCSLTKTLSVQVNTAIPTFSINPPTQNITCSLSSAATVTFTAITPTVNIEYFVYSPHPDASPWGPSGNYTTAYVGGFPGVYTVTLADKNTGCMATKQFTITSTLTFPTFTLASSPANFTLGCFSKATITLNLLGIQSGGGGTTSHTIIPPGGSGSTTYTSGTTWTANVAGTYTAVVRDVFSQCETRIERSVLANTTPPPIDTIIVPHPVLSCANPVTTLTGVSDSTNVSYQWSFPGTPGIVQGSTVTVSTNTAATTSSLLPTYTLLLTDNNSKCITTQTVPMYQNLYTPSAGISPKSTTINCGTPTLVLTNDSKTTIPPNTFPVTSGPIAQLWEGPVPQDPLASSSSYTAGVEGVYTVTVIDPNNGCISKGNATVTANTQRPVFENTLVPTLDCGAATTTLMPNISTPTANLTYTWTAPQNAIVQCPKCPVLTTNLAGTYTLLVTNTVNACAATTTIAVNNGSLTPSIAIDRNRGFAPMTVTFFNNSTSSLGQGSITTVWSFGNGKDTTTKSTSTEIRQLYQQPGVYKIFAIVSKGLCVQTVTSSITVEAPSRLEIPNIFSPNNDKINDVYFLKATNLSSIQMYIYDRWGHKVYELLSSTGQLEWDGKNQFGIDVAEGTYYYILNATGSDGEEYKDLKGNITLVR